MSMKKGFGFCNLVKTIGWLKLSMLKIKGSLLYIKMKTISYLRVKIIYFIDHRI